MNKVEMLKLLDIERKKLHDEHKRNKRIFFGQLYNYGEGVYAGRVEMLEYIIERTKEG